MFQKKTLGAGIAALALTGFLVWGAAAFAQGPGHFGGFGAHHGRMLQHLATVLDLSESQTTQIRSIVDGKMETARPLLMQLRQNHQAFQQAIESGKTDTASLQPLADQVGKTVAQLALLRAQAVAEIYPILTPEQREKAKKLHQSLLGE